VLDLVMCGRADQVLDFDDPVAPNGSLAAPSAPFGQLLAAAFDEAMTLNGWATFTGGRLLAQTCVKERPAVLGVAALKAVLTAGGRNRAASAA